MERKPGINPYIPGGVALVATVISIVLDQKWIAFMSLAPLFAVIDVPPGEAPWRRITIVGVCITLIALSNERFYSYAYAGSAALGVSSAICFGLYVVARDVLGNRTGKVVIVLLWLTVEYIVLKLGVASDFMFVGELTYSDPEWTSWTVHTGYVGGCLWLLLANLLFYEALLRGGMRVGFLVAFLALVILPFVYSFTSQIYMTISKPEMVMLYAGLPVSGAPDNYLSRGEWIPRTATWVSALVLSYVAVKSKTRKK